jgi:hypothetical protein
MSETAVVTRPRYVRLGSLADITAAMDFVRFVPEADIGIAPIGQPRGLKGYLASAAPFSASISRFSSSGVSCGRSIVSVILSILPVKLNGGW